MCIKKKVAEMGRVIVLQIRRKRQVFALKFQVRSLNFNFEFRVLIKSLALFAKRNAVGKTEFKLCLCRMCFPHYQ